MERNRAKEEIVSRWEDILRQITSPAKEKVNGHTSYICPLCGHGAHGDGLAINPRSKKYGLKCFGTCNFSGDIIDLVGEVHGLRSYPEKLQRAGEYLHIEIDPYTPVAQNQPKNEQDTHTHMNIHINTQADTHTEADYTAYIKECQTRLQDTNYHTQRGISDAVARAYGLGYDPHASGTGGQTWQALIIPTGKGSYVARNTDPQAESNRRYKNTGRSTPLNTVALQTATKPIFITEGELDALSIIEVGGEAIGLGSTANIDLFIEEYVKKHTPSQILIPALDNDEQGRKANEKLVKALEELGIPFYRLDPYNGLKDASEALQADREAFTKAVARAEHLEEEKLEAEREEYLKTSTANYIEEFINGVQESAITPAQPTFFKELDSKLDGGLYEGLYIIGAITSLGKTTLALQIADQIAKGGKNIDGRDVEGRDVLIFSLEMARTELMSKSISRHTLLRVLKTTGDTRQAKTNRGITAGSRYKNYSPEELYIIDKSVEDYSQYAQHIYIHEGVGNIGVNAIRETIQKHRQYTGQTPVVLVDYVQILAPYDVRATDKQNTDKAVLELKRISRDYKTPVIAISSFNRASYSEKVTLEAFKESGAIEYGSDVLIGLQLKGAGSKNFDSTEEKKKDPREVELVILKNRNGRTGDTISYRYYPMFNYFEEG